MFGKTMSCKKVLNIYQKLTEIKEKILEERRITSGGALMEHSEGKFVYGGISCENVEEIVDLMRVNPPKNKKGENLWLQDSAYNASTRHGSIDYGFESFDHDNTTVDI
eukprot:m.299984 g.299984  ORF g.299984 m.299984 type:complete len:108 (-) comp16417_c3_seq1:95-418(-)